MSATFPRERERVLVGNSYALSCHLTNRQTSLIFISDLWLRPFPIKKVPLLPTVTKGRCLAVPPFLKSYCFSGFIVMITESPWRIRPAPRWSSLASCQAALNNHNPLCDISQLTVLINAFTPVNYSTFPRIVKQNQYIYPQPAN